MALSAKDWLELLICEFFCVSVQGALPLRKPNLFQLSVKTQQFLFSYFLDEPEKLALQGLIL